MGVKNTNYLKQVNKLLGTNMESEVKIEPSQYEQKLVNLNEILDNYDDKFLLECCSCKSPVLHIAHEIRSEMQIFIKTIDDKIVTFEMEHSNKIRDVRMKIEKKTKLSAEQQNLFYQGKILIDDERTIGGYGICDGDVIDIVARLGGGMQIFARTMDDRIVSIEVHESERIIDIKQKIQEKIRLNTDGQKLLYHAGILSDDERTIGQYGMCDGDVIDIVARLGGIQIFAKTGDGKTVAFEVHKSERIIDTKYKIQEKTGLHPYDQNLFYQGVILNDDDKTIDEYGICDGCVINIVVRLRNGMLIIARTMDGKTVEFEAQKSYKIIDIKKKIQEKTGLHSNEQKLLYQGKILNDNERTIDEYQICDRSVIDIADRLRNGIQIFAEIHGRIVAVEVLKLNKIIDIKKKIQEKIGLHRDEQELFYQGGILDDERIINDYQITEKSVVDVVARLRNGVQIFIKTSDKSIIPINIVNTSRIIDVKSIIREKTGIQLAGNNNLIYKTNILYDDKKSLIDYQIEDGSVISIDTDNSQFFMFIRAIQSGLLEEVENLYDNKFREMRNKLFLTSPMHYACKQNNPDIVKFLIKNNLKINSYDGEYNKPIHYACINNNLKILETLIQKKCNLDVPDLHGMKPIHLACLNGNFKNVKLLIGNGCDLESKDKKGRRPIHLACLAGNIDIVKLLIENKCEIDVLDKFNKSPFDIAEKENLINILEILNEEISRRMMEKMITELVLTCNNFCDHNFCPTSLREKTFNKGVRIGHGGNGKVYRCSHQIATKQVSKVEMNSKNIEGNINRFIKKINHERVIKYYGAMSKNENIFIFMEFMSKGSLKSQISTNPPMESSKVFHYTMQVLEGLQFLHEKKIIHRDIKPDNILLDDDGNVKLTDLGLGLSLCKTFDKTTQADTFCGTAYYMAPEIVNGEKYSYSADIWALGATVIEMATGKHPYEGFIPEAVIFKIGTTKTIPYQLTESSPKQMKLLIDKMIIPDPSQRSSATDLIHFLKTSK